MSNNIFKRIIVVLALVLLVAIPASAASIVSTDGAPDSSGQYPVAVDSSGSVTIKAINYAAPTSTQDAYAIALSPADLSYSTGQTVVFIANTENVGACTLNVNGLGAKNLLMLNNQTPANDYIEDGSVVVAVYDGTSFQIVSPDANP